MPARRKTATKKASSSRKKWVYLFAQGKAEGNAGMRALLGGKGAGLAEMTNAGLPVPPGFTITTEACNAYFSGDKKLPPDCGIRSRRHSRQSRRPQARSSAIRRTPSSCRSGRVRRCRCPE